MSIPAPQKCPGIFSVGVLSSKFPGGVSEGRSSGIGRALTKLPGSLSTHHLIRPKFELPD